jgi:hypothetical protein
LNKLKVFYMIFMIVAIKNPVKFKIPQRVDGNEIITLNHMLSTI